MPTDAPNRRTNLAERSAAVSLLYVACLVVFGPTLRLSQWYMPADNQAAAEALSWLDGRLDVPNRALDMAQYQGRFYNVFPPLWTVICYLVYGLNSLLFGERLIFWTNLYVLVAVAPIPPLV